MDLLAAVYLSRAEVNTLPSATALCLRRAALQGQPANASLASRLGIHLADVGLFEEARWVLEHSLSIQADQQTSEALVKVLRRTGHGDAAADLIARMGGGAGAASIAPGGTRSGPRMIAPKDAAVSDPNRPRVPDITQLSPADFAALSRPVMPIPKESVSSTRDADSHSTRLEATGNTSFASARTNVARVVTGDEDPSQQMIEQNVSQKPSLVRRFMDSFRSVW
jgi:hypothetical protein